MKKLALYGAGDLGIVLLELYMNTAKIQDEYDEVFFVDDDSNVNAPYDIPLVNFVGLLHEAADHDVRVAICIGEPRVRHIIADKVREAGLSLATLIDPSARVSRKAEIGAGCIVSGWSSIGPNARVGDNTLVLSSSVSHNSTVGESCVLNSNSILSCHVDVGDQSFLNIGAMVREGVKIGARVIVGMGSAVFLDVEDDLFVVGNPARPMRRNDDRRVFRS